MRVKIYLGALLGSSVFIIGCATTTLDQRGVQAQTGAPLVSQVAEVSIPRDPSRPTALVMVEPFTTPVAVREMPDDWIIRVDNESANLTQKLTTALVRTGNIAVVDPRGVRARPDGTFSAQLHSGEQGPYLIRAVITEFTEKAVEENTGQEISLTWLGIALGIAGVVADKPGLAWPGFGLAAIDPSYNDSKMTRSGMVGFDIQVVDGRTLRVVDAFKATGTFSAEEDKSGFGLFGYSSHRDQFAKSVLGQAAQAAMNDAVVKIRKALI